MADPHLIVHREGHVVVVTMNRPEAKNAWSLEMLARMWAAWQEIDADNDVRVAILTGANGTFSAGADLKLMHGDQSANPWHAQFKADPELHWKAMLRHYRLKKPLIAAIEGYALGGGTEIMQCTDLRVCGKSAVFGLTESAYGLFPLGGSTVRLQRQIPYAAAMEMLLTGRRVTASEALGWGLINRVVEDGQALPAAMEFARQIAANAPLSVQAIKRAVIGAADLGEAEGLAFELEVGQPIFRSEDAREGPRAFAERRIPQFKGC